MLLKKIDIYGFKSFADKIHIDFDEGITAIVGPNGSGKSNISDAVRWVLGEQSAKTLRGTKMEDIIFSGTQVRKPLGFAEVSLTIDNSDAALPVDYSEVTVTRRIFRSGESEYYINRSSCRLKDIIEMFMDTGIGKEGYSIIGQGRIDEILSVNSEDRRVIFEEAAGIVKYKARREEAERKLDKTSENLIRVEDILSEIEQQLEPLKIQSEKARQYLKLKEQLKFFDVNKFIIQYRSYSERIKDFDNQIKLLDIDIQKHKEYLLTEENKQNEYKAQLSKLNEIINDTKEQKYQLFHDSEKKNGEIGIFNEKIDSLSRENERLCIEINIEKKYIEDKTKEIESLNTQLTDKTNQLNILNQKYISLTGQLRQYETEMSARQLKIDNIKTGVDSLSEKLANAKNNLFEYKTQEKSFMEVRQQISNQIKEKTIQFDLLQNQQHDLEDSLKFIKIDMDKVLNKKRQLTENIDADKNTIADLKANIQSVKQNLEGKKSRLRLMEDMKNEYEGFNKSIKSILKACERDNVLSSKVCGVVAQLINVPKQFETAVEVALGGSLQNIVTENEQDAKYIIQFLKKNKYGIATFLPISSIRPRSLNNSERSVLNMEGCLGILSELVECDNKYKSILDYLLGRVVVAQNIDCAIQMAKKYNYSFRIVTLDGDLFNQGGSMTGGSREYKGTRLLGRDREINTLKAQVSKEQSSLAMNEDKLANLVYQYDICKNDIIKLEDQFHQLEIKNTSQSEKLQAVYNQSAKINEELKNLETEDEHVEQKLYIVKEKAIDIQKEIELLKNQSTAIHESMESGKNTLNNILKQKENITSKITNIKVNKAALEQEVLSIKQNRQYLESDILSRQTGIEKKQKQIEENGHIASVYSERICKMRQSIKIIEQNIEKINDQIKECENQIVVIEEQMHEAIQKIKSANMTIDDITSERHRFDVSKSRFEVELKNLQENMWNEYELSYSNALEFFDSSLSLNYLNDQIKALKNEIQSLGEVNVNAIENYKDLHERFIFLDDQRNDLLLAKEDLKNIIKNINKTMEQRFKEEFAVINNYFNEVFIRLFGGGKAQLVLQDEDDVLECGIEIVAQPPGKKLQNLSLLSGGEKALTAIAILFAILKHKPTPFCILDEIDAALDESNIYSFAQFLKDLSGHTQFVLITHRKGTMESSDVLYGIAMEEKGVSKMISVKLDDKAS